MKIKDILNEYKFETLNSPHVLSDFCCDSNELNEVGIYQSSISTQDFTIKERGTELICYSTLSLE